MNGTLLIVEAPQDSSVLRTVEVAAARQGLTVTTWTPGITPPRPTALLACLGRGARRMPAAVSQLADSRFPDLPVILLSDEPLVQPSVLLAGGRISLLGAPLTDALLEERLAAATRWGQSAVVPAAYQLRRSEIRSGRARAALVLGEGPGRPADRLETSLSLGLTAVLTGHADRPLTLAQDILPALDAWQDQPDADHLRRSLALRGQGAWRALVHLDADANRWLLSAPTDSCVAVASPLRHPGWWRLCDQGEGPIRVLPAEAGDVVVAISQLPEGEAFSPAALAGAAAQGAAALADHLGESAKAMGVPLAALAVEIGS